jgi:hypothetical protein
MHIQTIKKLRPLNITYMPLLANVALNCWSDTLMYEEACPQVIISIPIFIENV